MICANGRELKQVDRNDSVNLSLEIAELQAIVAVKLGKLASSEPVEELAKAVKIAEILARRWHMIEAIKSGLIQPPVIEEFDDALDGF